MAVNSLGDFVAAIDGGERDFAKIEEAYKENDIFSFESLSEMVDATNLDSGRAAMAMSLKEVGDVSPRFVSKNGNGYYFVKLTAREGSKVKYDSIWIRFTELDKILDGLRKDNKVEEMIELCEMEEDEDTADSIVEDFDKLKNHACFASDPGITHGTNGNSV